MIYHRQDRASCLKLLLSQLWDLKEMPQIVWCWRRWLRWRPWLEEGQASAFLVFTRQSMGLFFSSSAQCIIHSVYIAQCMYVPCLPLDVWCTLLDARSIVRTIFLLQLYSLHVNSGFYSTHCIGIPVDADTVMPGSCCTHKAEFVSPTWSWIDPDSWFRPNTFVRSPKYTSLNDIVRDVTKGRHSSIDFDSTRGHKYGSVSTGLEFGQNYHRLKISLCINHSSGHHNLDHHPHNHLHNHLQDEPRCDASAEECG